MVSRLLIVPLVLLIFSAIFYNLYVMSGGGIDDSIGANVNLGDVRSGTQTLNETETELGFEEGSSSVSFSLAGAGFGLIIATLVYATVIGIQVLGSGLSEFTVKMLVISAIWLTVWSFFSGLAYEAYVLVPFFGVPLYFVLSFVYCLGIADKGAL